MSCLNKMKIQYNADNSLYLVTAVKFYALGKDTDLETSL